MKHSPKNRLYRNVDFSTRLAEAAAVLRAASLAAKTERAASAPAASAAPVGSIFDIRTYDRIVEARRARVFGHKGTPHRDSNWS